MYMYKVQSTVLNVCIDKQLVCHVIPGAIQGGDVLMFLNEKRDVFLTVLSNTVNGNRYQGYMNISSYH